MIRRLPAEPGDPPLTPGRSYHRKVRGLRGLPHIRVVAVREQRLRDVTHQQAQLEEGYEGRRALSDFRRDWVRANDRWARLHPLASDADVDARWRQRHAARLVAVVTFDIVDPVRNLPEQRDILSGRTTHGPGNGQYVSSGGIDPEVEAVDPSTLAGYVADELVRRVAARAGVRTAKRESRRRRVIRYRRVDP